MVDDKAVVTVCDACLQASCWQGVFMCQAATGAGTVDKLVSELRALGLEHEDWWDIDPSTGCSRRWP